MRIPGASAKRCSARRASELVILENVRAAGAPGARGGRVFPVQFYSWNDFLGPLLYLLAQDTFTLPLVFKRTKASSRVRVRRGALLDGRLGNDDACPHRGALLFLQRSFLKGITGHAKHRRIASTFLSLDQHGERVRRAMPSVHPAVIAAVLSLVASLRPAAPASLDLSTGSARRRCRRPKRLGPARQHRGGTTFRERVRARRCRRAARRTATDPPQSGAPHRRGCRRRQGNQAILVVEGRIRSVGAVAQLKRRRPRAPR